jgi:hypothetical protein
MSVCLISIPPAPFDSPHKKGKKKQTEVPCTLAELEICRLTRDIIAKHCIKPWFQDYVRPLRVGDGLRISYRGYNIDWIL